MPGLDISYDEFKLLIQYMKQLPMWYVDRKDMGVFIGGFFDFVYFEHDKLPIGDTPDDVQRREQLFQNLTSRFCPFLKLIGKWY